MDHDSSSVTERDADVVGPSTVISLPLDATRSMTPSLSLSRLMRAPAELTHVSVTATAPLAATAFLGAISGVDPGAAQALVTTLQSPCSGTDTTSTPRGSVAALTPLVLFADEASIEPLDIALGHVGLALTLLLLHFLATRVLCRIQNELVPQFHANIVQRVACSTAAARLRFPSLSLKLITFLMPGVVWAVSTLLSDSDSDTYHVWFGVAVGMMGVAAFGYVCYYILHEWILIQSSHCGLNFMRFRSPQPFSPPIPLSIAKLVCSRHGQWGPQTRRSAFGSPMASTFLPQHVRWIWGVAPAVSLIAVGLSTARPPQQHRGRACDAIQALLFVLFFATAALFAWLRPHRAILRSLLCSFTMAHNAAVVLLTLLHRHEWIQQESILTVAAVGAYVALMFSVLLVALELFETRLLVTSSALEQEATLTSLPPFLPLDNRIMFATTSLTVRQLSGLQFLVDLTCALSNDDAADK
jgi:hypothetical protein